MNYGHGVMIGFVLFAGYILYFVYQSFNERIELVSEDYYAKEVAFQGQIDATHNATEFENEVKVDRLEDAVVVSLPAEHHHSIGSVVFFRPSDDRLDFSIPIQAQDSGKVTVPLSKLQAGRYEVQVSWEVDGTSMYVKKDVFL